MNPILERTDDSMVLEKKDGQAKGWWGVHSQKSRMVIWTPEEGFYIYIVRESKYGRVKLIAECDTTSQGEWRSSPWLTRHIRPDDYRCFETRLRRL